jgi:hypothetical protein
MLAPIVPSVDYKKAYQRKHQWKLVDYKSVKIWCRDNQLPVTLPELKLISFTEDEYNQVLTNPNWTLQETQNLMDLLQEYNLRFLIVHDRMNTTKSLEDIKHRYYQVNRLLLHHRNVSKVESQKQTIQSFSFDLVKENSRKQNLELLLHRTAEQVN